MPPRPRASGQQPGRQSGDLTVAGMQACRFAGRSLAKEFFGEGAAEPVPGKGRGSFAGEGQVADDHPDAVAVERSGGAVEKGLLTGMQQQVKERVEAAQERRIDRQTSERKVFQVLLDEAAL